ncbi:hypothetical protein [Pseudomonas sp.]|uniref:hypothetical protein n=1 Tax=Pseudomonas sp. TaxID=306 RepID=UPI003C62DD4C
MRLSLCATSVALFWGLEGWNVTFLHQNVLIHKRYIIQLRAFRRACAGFFLGLAAIYPAVLRGIRGMQRAVYLQIGTESAFVKCTFY